MAQAQVQVIVVGGGLAGLSAAHTLLERGANVLLLDKQGYLIFFGGFLLLTNALITLVSWVETPPKPLQASTVLVLKLSMTTTSQTRRRYSLTIQSAR